MINVGGTGSAGKLIIDGNFTQAGTGSLNIEIGGYKARSDFDQLFITGQAALDGTLNVTLMNNFIPSLGNCFQIIMFAG